MNWFETNPSDLASTAAFKENSVDKDVVTSLALEHVRGFDIETLPGKKTAPYGPY